MRTMFIALTVATGVLLARPAAALDPLVRVTSCEPVTVGGHPAQRLTLAVAGQLQFFDSVAFWPQAVAGVDTCAIFDFTPPPGWKAFYGGVGGMVLFLGQPVDLGQSLDGFVITVTDVNCCYEVDLGNFLLLDSPGHGIACFHDCVATQTRGTSWGSVKAAYR